MAESKQTPQRPLQVHHLRPAPGAKQAKIRVGRGEGGRRGKTAGRGTKGTKARYQVPAGFEGGQIPLHMRLPKLRGFTNPFRVEYQVRSEERRVGKEWRAQIVTYHYKKNTKETNKAGGYTSSST